MIVGAVKSRGPVLPLPVQNRIAIVAYDECIRLKARDRHRARRRIGLAKIRNVAAVADNELCGARGAERRCGEKMNVAGQYEADAAEIAILRSDLLREVDWQVLV